MIKQQKQHPTDQSKSQIPKENCCKIPLNTISSSFKERINQLKAKIKPCIEAPLLLREQDLSLSYQNQNQKFPLSKEDKNFSSCQTSDKYLNNSLNFQIRQENIQVNTQRNKNVEKVMFSRKGSISESESEDKELGRMLSQRKVIQMRVSYRRQPNIMIKSKKRNINKIGISSSQKIQKQKVFQLKLNIKKVQSSEKKNQKENGVNEGNQLEKQNRVHNCFEIEDILIHNAKTLIIKGNKNNVITQSEAGTDKINMKQRERNVNPIKAKKQKIIKGVTKINVRQCSARSSTNLQHISRKNSDINKRILEHIKTQCAYSKIK